MKEITWGGMFTRTLLDRWVWYPMYEFADAEGKARPDTKYYELNMLEELAANLQKLPAKDVPTKSSVESYSLANLPKNVSVQNRYLFSDCHYLYD